MEEFKEEFINCDVCMQTLPISETTSVVTCHNCGKHHHVAAKSATLTLAFSLTALILYIPANMFPFMTMELYGNRNSSTIWGGVVSLVDSGSWFLAIIVFLASLLIPFIKLLVLFFISTKSHSAGSRRFKTKLYFIIEAIGRWSMLDIFLLAIFVAIMKLGHWTSVEPEIGSGLFALVVIFTLLASANFDPKLLWEDSNDNTEE
jgi:paraquat-inducible protein A